jgi:hypothetical protein
MVLKQMTYITLKHAADLSLSLLDLVVPELMPVMTPSSVEIIVSSAFSQHGASPCSYTVKDNYTYN